jgi:hypothetical protein
MDEETSTPYVDWEYVLIGQNEAWDDGFLRRADYPPVGEWHIEFRGRTRGGELLLANYFPSEDEDAREWLSSFASASCPSVPVSIDTYMGPTDEPLEPLFRPDDYFHPGAEFVDVAHVIYIGQGWAQFRENEVIITIPPEVFHGAAGSILGYRSKYTHIEQRIFEVFAKLSPPEFSEFWEAFKRPVYPDNVFSFDDVCRKALWRERPIRFHRQAGYDCLKLLHLAAGEVVTYSALTGVLRAEGITGNIRLLDAPPELKTCISHLRASLKAVGCSCEIDNIRNVGYRLIPSR